MLTKIQNTLIAATALTFTTSTAAFANKDFGIGHMADRVTTQLDSVWVLITIATPIIGLYLLVTGLMKLKTANDSQGQKASYGDGLIRCLIGGLMAASVGMTGVIQDTLIDPAQQVDSVTKAKSLKNSFNDFGK